MKIYVDELPNNCKECSLHRRGCLKVKKGGRYIDAETCVLGNFFKFQEIDDEIDTCPLETTQSLKQQVREEVVDEIKKRLAEQRTKMQDDTHCYPHTVVCWQDIVEILDQVKGENNVKD